MPREVFDVDAKDKAEILALVEGLDPRRRNHIREIVSLLREVVDEDWGEGGELAEDAFLAAGIFASEMIEAASGQ